MELLKSVAAAATQKPWELIAFDSGHSQYEYECLVVTEDLGDEIFSMNALTRLRNEVDAKNDGLADANFIATFDPPTVNSLLNEIESDLAQRKAARASIETLLKHHQPALAEGHRGSSGTCTGCHSGTVYPCPTRATLEPLLELFGESP